MHVNELGWEERRASSVVTPWVKADTCVYHQCVHPHFPRENSKLLQIPKGSLIPSPHAKLRTIALELSKY